MSGRCLEKLPHDCGTRHGLQVFAREEDSQVDGFCFSCGEFVRHPYGEPVEAETIPKPKEKTAEDVAEELAEIATYKTLTLRSRKLRAETLSYFKIKISTSTVDGETPLERFYPYRIDGVLTGYKVKTVVGKKMWTVGSTRGVDFFGWEEAVATGSKKLIVTTGEDDAVAIRRVIDKETKPEYKDFKPAVVSCVHGDGSALADFMRMRHKIQRHFKEIILAFDMDDSGQKAAQEVSKAFPEAVVAALPSKDANQALIDGKIKALYNAVVFNAKRKKNSRIVSARDMHDKAREVAKWGELTWPWPTLQDKTRGIRWGETIYIGAGVKMGKSEILNALAAHFITQDNAKVFLIKPEEGLKKTYKLLAGKVVGKVFHDPKVEMDFEAYDKAGKVLDDHMDMLELYQHVRWEQLKGDIIDAVHTGSKVIMIDPITNLTNGMDAGEANVKLQEIAQDLSALALDHEIVIFIFCHLKAPEGNLSKEQREYNYARGNYHNLGNCPHELGGSVLSAQFAGSRAMMRSCNYMLALEGNKDEALDEEVRNTRYLRLLEDREFGEVGTIKLWWNRATTLFKEMLQ